MLPSTRYSLDETSFFHKKRAASLLLQDGHRLVSGSKDTTLIVWDVVNEAGLYRLKGHKGPVTNVAFMSKPR